MKFVIDVPDEYIPRWMNLSETLGINNFDLFILHSLGIGIQTISTAISATKNEDAADVIQFPNKMWDQKEIVNNSVLK